MRKLVHYAPSSEEMATYHMTKHSDENYDYYKINLALTTEGQKERLAHRFGIALRILEDEPSLTLYTIRNL